MAFRDPYRDPYVTQQYNQPPVNQPRYGQPAPEFNPYVRSNQPYDQRDSSDYDSDYHGYRDKPVPAVPGYHSLEASQPTLVSNDMAAEPAEETVPEYDYMAAAPKRERLVTFSLYSTLPWYTADYLLIQNSAGAETLSARCPRGLVEKGKCIAGTWDKSSFD
jgi:hypothetical protein